MAKLMETVLQCARFKALSKVKILINVHAFQVKFFHLFYPDPIDLEGTLISSNI